MAFIEASIPPTKVWVRDGFFFNDPDNPKYKNKYTQAILVSIRCNEGSAALFQVITEHGMMRDKLPISAICWEKPEDYGEWDKYPFHYLQLWDCFSKVFSIVTLNYVYNAKVDILLKNKEVISGHYMYTIQWGGNENTGTDLTLAEDPSEHKSHHVIALDNGMFAIQPNNRIIKWYDPSFTTKQYDGEPWKINELEFCCEHHERWVTEDSESYFYDADEPTYTLDEVKKELDIMNAITMGPYEVRDMETNQVIRSFEKQLDAETFIWAAFKSVEERMKYYVSMPKSGYEQVDLSQMEQDKIIARKRHKELIKNMKRKAKLAAPKPKKGAKKKTTFLYGGPAK